MRRDAWAEGGWTVLVVEDEADIRESLVELLAETLPGTRVLAAPTGEDGLAVLGREHVDLVLSDYRLPGMDGLRFLKAARDTSPQALRFLITAFADLEVESSALEGAGVEAVVLKPLDAAPLVARLRSSLRKAAARTGRTVPA